MLKKVPLYPFLIGVYPVLALGAHNIVQINISEIWRPLAFSLLVTGLVLGLGYLLLRDWHRAAMVAAVLLLVFFTYGQVYAEVKGIVLAGIFPFRHRVLVVLWGILLIAGVIGAWRWLKNPMGWTPWLNLVSALLLVYPVVTIASTLASQELASLKSNRPVAAAAAESATVPGSPDIYYIILDAYGRHDLLKDKLGYDNGDFINGLKARGFYVAECSQSNYAQTLLSLGSSLNMDYIDPKMPISALFEGPYVKHGAVRTFLESQGYKTAAFPTGFPYTEWTDANTYYKAQLVSTSVTEFETLLAQTTLLRASMDMIEASRIDAAFKVGQNRRMRAINALSGLKNFGHRSGRLFVFAHIVLPHPPYVFGANGEAVVYGKTSTAVQRQAYDDQARFVSNQMLEVVDTILATSDKPPIIIVQGDHGPPVDLVSHAERMRNLSAYYLPGVDASKVLYPSITPVNSFRVILNQYFGEDLPLIEDRSYFTTELDLSHAEPIGPSCPAQP